MFGQLNKSFVHWKLSMDKGLIFVAKFRQRVFFSDKPCKI